MSASHYDGGAATAEAALMTVRQTKRERVLVSRAIHRHFLDTTATYFEGGRLSLEELPTLEDGRRTSRRSSASSQMQNDRSPVC